jgi:hypothetical protein
MDAHLKMAQNLSSKTGQKQMQYTSNSSTHALISLAKAMHKKNRKDIIRGSTLSARRGPRPKRYDLLELTPFQEKIMKQYIKNSIADRPVKIDKFIGQKEETKTAVDYYEFIHALNKKLASRNHTIKMLANNHAYAWIKDLQSRKVEKPTMMEVLLLDTSYINSIVSEGENIKIAISSLREAMKRKSKSEVEIVLTREVYNELLSQLKGVNGPKKDEYGRPVFTSKALNELHEMIGNGIICLEEYTTDEETSKEFSALLKKRNRKGNSRIGKGEISILKYIKDMTKGLTNISFRILTTDSDIFKLLRGCEGIVKVVKGYRQKQRKECEAVA